jgi:hypothetical protein
MIDDYVAVQAALTRQAHGPLLKPKRFEQGGFFFLTRREISRAFHHFNHTDAASTGTATEDQAADSELQGIDQMRVAWQPEHLTCAGDHDLALSCRQRRLGCGLRHYAAFLDATVDS